MSDCFTSLKENFPDMKDEQIRSILKDLENTRDNSETLKKFADEVQARADKLRLDQAKYRFERQQNFQKLQQNLATLSHPTYEGNPVAGLKQILMGGRDQIGKNSNLGIKLDANATVNSILTPALDELRAKNLLEHAVSGSLDKEAMIEVYESREGGQPGKSGSPIAVEIAKVMKTVNDSVRAAWEAAGNPIGNIQGYIMRQAHDMAKIAADKVGWMKSMWNNLDHEKTFGPDFTLGDTPEEVKQAKIDWLNDRWKAHKDGTWSYNENPSGVSDEYIKSYAPGSGRKVPNSRTYFFKDGESFYNYNSQFGKGGLMGAVFQTVRNDALKIAQVKQFGTKPFDAFMGLVKRMEDKHAATNPKLSEEVTNAKGWLEMAYKLTANMNQHPGVSTAAKISNNTSAVVNMSVLGLSSLKKFTEWKEGAQLVSAVTGENYWKSLGQLGLNFVRTGMPTIPLLNPETSQAQRNLISKFLINHIDDLTAAQNVERYGPNMGAEHTNGIMSKMENLMYNLGINQHTNASRLATTMTISRFLGDAAPNSFENLNPTLRGNLGRWGIGAAEWDVIRQGMDTITGDSKGVTSEAIRSMDLSKVQSVMDKYDIKGKPENFRKNVLDKQLSMFLEMSERTVLHTNANTAALMYARIPNPNDPMSALARVILQYKSIPLMFGHNAVMSLGSGMESMSPSFSNAMTAGIKNGSIANMAAGAATGAGLYYLRTVLYNELHGKEFPNYKDPKVITESMMGGGVPNMITDLLYATMHGGTERGLKAVAGPAPTMAFDAVSALGSRNANKGVKLAEDITPFQSVPFVRPALDSMIFDHIHNAIDPAWTEKRDMREQRNRAKAGL